MKKKWMSFLACLLALSLLFGMNALAQAPQPAADTQAPQVTEEADPAGDSTGDSTDLSEEEIQFLLQLFTSVDGDSEGTETESTEGAEDAEGSSFGDSAGSSGGESGVYGSPWVDTLDAGNLPEEAPKVVDNLQLHYAYDVVAEYQDGITTYAGISATIGELQDFIIEYLKDESHDSNEMQQLRIFFDQAADTQKLKETGLSELQPYLDMVAGAQSIEELNAVLTSEEFPFNPWLILVPGAMAQDRSENNHLLIWPCFMFVDTMLEEMLVDSDDPMVQLTRQMALMSKGMYVTDALTALSVPYEEAGSLTEDLLDIEKQYGAYLNTNDVKYQEYGVYANTLVKYTMEELEQVSPNFPLAGIITRFGKDKASGFASECVEWIPALNELWTEDNLQNLKLITQCRMIIECQNILDPDIFQTARTALEEPEAKPEERAFAASSSLDTFSHLLAKTYTEEFLGEETVQRISTMTRGLIDTYKKLVDDTEWLGEESRQKVKDKLDNMKLNILYPDGGYISYEGLALTPTEEGGTVMSNYLRLKEYVDRCETALLDNPAQTCMTWYCFKPTALGAYYSEYDNSINIMPGTVTSNVYSREMTDAEMLGGIGYCVGHEISHGFDFRGSQMDQYGRVGSVFTEEDVKAFLMICDDLAAYYSTIEYMPGQFVDGKRVVVEAGADLSGMQVILAYAAQICPEEGYEKLFERASRIFVVVGPQGTAYLYAVADSHPLSYLRVNVNAQMFDAMYDTYGIKEGDGMYLAPESRIKYWGK